MGKVRAIECVHAVVGGLIFVRALQKEAKAPLLFFSQLFFRKGCVCVVCFEPGVRHIVK